MADWIPLVTDRGVVTVLVPATEAWSERVTPPAEVTVSAAVIVAVPVTTVCKYARRLVSAVTVEVPVGAAWNLTVRWSMFAVTVEVPAGVACQPTVRRIVVVSEDVPVIEACWLIVRRSIAVTEEVPTTDV